MAEYFKLVLCASKARAENHRTARLCAMSPSVASSGDEHEDNVKNNGDNKSAENSNAQVFTTSLTVTAETTTLQEAKVSGVAKVTPEKNKEDAGAAKRKSRFELHKEIKKSNPVPMNMTRRIHNALRSTTKFLYEATTEMRYAEKKRIVMNVLYPFHTECNGVVMVLVKENNPNQGGFLGGLLTSELLPIPHNVNIPREKRLTIAEKVGIHFLMKLRSESEIEREHKVLAVVTEQARARALKNNKEPYSGHHTTPVFVHYPATLERANFMQQKGNLEKFAELFASKIEVALSNNSAANSLVNMYKVAPLFDFRTSDDEGQHSKIFLGHILTPNDILKIVGPVLDIYSWDAFLGNSDAMDMYFGTGDLRKEVEQLKGGKFFASSFNPVDTESMADKQAKLAAEKKKKADEEDDFLAKFGG